MNQSYQIGIGAEDGVDTPVRTYRHGTAVLPSADNAWSAIFIEEGIVGLFVTPAGERPTCVGIVGAGGVIGPELLPGGCKTVCRALGVVRGVRVPQEAFERALGADAEFRQSYVRHLHSRLAQIHQVAMCNVRHSLSARCAHWLLVLQDQIGDTLPVTHELISTILGVRRAGVGLTIQALQRDGIVRQSRGSLAILDSQRLRQAACSCPVWSPFQIAPETMEAIRPGMSPAPTAVPITRERIESAILVQQQTLPSWSALARGEAALQVCRNIIAETASMLSQC